RTPSLADDPALGLSPRAKLEILGAVLLALFLGALDQTIVGTALPRIVTDLGGNEYYTWVVTIYLLTSTITVPFYGKLSDLYGRKPMMMFGVFVFLIGSALSGLSQNMAMLILFRGIQGIGAGALFPIALAVIGDLYTPAERGRYQGLFGAVFGISFIIGPALGGLLTDFVSWHWIFYVNIPIGIVSLIVLARLLPTIKREGATRNFDLAGASVFIVAISALLVGLTNKQTGEWTDPAVGGLILASAILGAIFVAIEARATEPIIPLGMFRNRTYTASIVSTFLVSFGFFGAIIFLPRWFQFVNGSSATESGYQIFPLLIGLIGSSIISGILVSRTGRYKAIILTGLVLMTAGIALMTQLRADTEITTLWAWMFVTGAGIGPTLSVFTIVVQNAVPFKQLGVATSNLTFFRQIGGSVGLAVTGTIFGTRLVEELPRQLTASGVPAQAVSQISGAGTSALDDLVGVGGDLGGQILATVPEAFRSAVEPMIPLIVAGIHEAFTIGVTAAFQLGVVTTILAAGAALFLHEIPLRTHTGEAPASAPATLVADARAPRLTGSPSVD
ncbi:MAG TPA: MDR family MFS transporter, partial [Candidatus Polarisedimenticolia bacterium]|nr:MDR family MFS transporter [Candidatus Polarisedimenticolia bacterium]